jgi:hypothetical protein
MEKLSEQMIQDMRLRGLSPLTEEAYLRYCARFVRFHQGRSPAEMGIIQVNGYLGHLEQQGVGPSVRRSTAAALCFLYRVTLDRPEVAARIPRVRVPLRQPDIRTCQVDRTPGRALAEIASV